MQVIAGNHTGTCSPVVGQQVSGANTAQAAVTNNSGNANDSPSVNNGDASGNGRGTGGTENHNITAINQNVSVSCFNNTTPQTVTKTVVVPQTVTKTVVVPQTNTVVQQVQQAPVASAVTTTAHFTG
ncbi:MAG TPA: hypothetical protein VGF64_14220 [Acidimicrobiales bacterium]